MWLDPPDSWHLDASADIRELGDYKLTSLGKNKTRLDMVFQLSYDDPKDVRDKKEWEKEVLEEWDTFGKYLEKDYKKSIARWRTMNLPEHHRVALDTFHYLWSRSHKPALSINDGDTVTFEINDVGSWQINKDSRSSDLVRFDESKLYPLAGPVFVEGAGPGDALVVEVLEVSVADFGWSFIQPGFGLLAEDFKRHFLYKWDLKNKRFATFKGGIKVPLSPFCGVLGVAPKTRGFTKVGPPGSHAGNVDIRHLTVGSWIKIPVWTEGASSRPATCMPPWVMPRSAAPQSSAPGPPLSGSG